ncbi:hypothetical protein D3C85_997070 [compost metagenome]
MIDAAKEPSAPWSQQLHVVLRITGEVPRIGDQKFDLLLAQPQRQLLPVTEVETGADRRVRLDELRQGFGHQQLRRIRAAAELQFATGQAVVLGQFVVQRLTAGQQTPGVLQHQFALAGQAELAAAALHQRAIEVPFQGLDAAAEGRLAEVDRFGGAAKTAVIGQCDEVAKLS